MEGQNAAAEQVPSNGTLADVIDRILDKGLVINADITVSLVDVELLSIRIRAVLCSLETAARYGLELPSGTNTATDGWRDAQAPKDNCPQCGKRNPLEELLGQGCPWCGWVPAKLRALTEAS
jgi:hypothetical protein